MKRIMRTPPCPSTPGLTPRRRQRGMAIVEFAFVAMIFFTLLLGIMEFGRWMFTLNAAAEATRWGARLAAVCSIGDTGIEAKMRFILGSLDPARTDQILINYTPTGCNAGNCEKVKVSLQNVSFTPLIPIPFMGVAVPIPPFTTSLPRELMNSDDNPICD